MEIFGISTTFLLSIFAAIAIGAIIANKTGDKAEKMLHGVGSRIGWFYGTVASFFVFNLCALYFEFKLPDWLASFWPWVHGPFDTIRDLLFGEIDKNGDFTMFEIKRIGWLLFMLLLLLFSLFGSHWIVVSVIFGIFATIIVSMATSRIISPFEGEVATTAYSFSPSGPSGSGQPSSSFGFLERTLKFFIDYWKMLLVFAGAIPILLYSLKKMKPKDAKEILSFATWAALGAIVLLGLFLWVVYSHERGTENPAPYVVVFVSLIGAVLFIKYIITEKPGTKEEEHTDDSDYD